MFNEGDNCLEHDVPLSVGSASIIRSTDFSHSESITDTEISSSYVVDQGRSWKPDVESILTPSKGHVFGSLSQAFEFYSHYGKLGGFDVKLGTEKNYHSTEFPNIKYFHCSRYGKKNESKYDKHSDDKSTSKVDKGKSKSADGAMNNKGKGVVSSDVSESCVKKSNRKNTSCKTDCKAKMCVRKVDGGGGGFEVYVFVEEHNHPLVAAGDMQFLMNSRSLGYSKQQFLCDMSNSNVGPVKAFKLMKEMCGGFENIGATAVDCKNFRRDMNLFIGDMDAQMVVEKLEGRKQHCDDFFVDYYQGEGDALCGLFWADKIAKLNYKRFGDVMSFDATFRSNRYRMVFVPFTGIDNHNRSVTFGAGLLADETVNSYKWLLQAFNKAHGARPQVVVTDQDASMKQAIETELVNTKHRLCMWHIMQKLTTKVGSSICNQGNFKQRFCSIVWTDRISPELFEQQWADIMKDFNLCDHKWLSDLYDMRARWIPAFLRNEDMSGLMRTTSRSESENNYFNRFTNPDLSLVEFMSHYDSAMEAQRYNQRKNDHESRYNYPVMKTGLQVEHDASKLYTPNVFYDVQDEIVASTRHCLSERVETIGLFEKYLVRDTELKKWTDKDAFEVYEVLYCKEDTSITCSCRKFELFGLLCRHIFYVLRLNNVDEFPTEYLLDRWCKTEHNDWYNATDAMGESSSAGGVRAIRQIIEDTIDRLAPYQDKLDIYKAELSELLAKAKLDVPVVTRMNKKDVFCSMLGVTEPSSVRIQVPKQSKNKGSGSHTRWKNIDELIRYETAASKKRRICFSCGRAEGHNSRTCPNRNTSNASSNKRPARGNRSTINYRE